MSSHYYKEEDVCETCATLNRFWDFSDLVKETKLWQDLPTSWYDPWNQRYIVKLSVDGAPLGACVSAGPSAGAPSPSTAAQRRAQRRLTREDNRYHSGGSARSNVTPQLPLSLPSFSRLFALQFNPPSPPRPFLPIFNLSFLTVSHFTVVQNYRVFPYTIFYLLSRWKHSYRLRKSWWLIDIDNRIQTISTLLIAGVMTDCLSHSCDMREMRKKGEV